MTKVGEFYQQIGANYESVIKMLMSDQRIENYLQMFTRDQTFSELKQAMADKEYQTAFRAAHTLKGVALNLGFSRLTASASRLTEALRGNDSTDGCDELFAGVLKDYEEIIRIYTEMFVN